MVRWNQGNNSKTQVSDRWSQTYVTREKSPERRSPSRGPLSSDTPVEPQASRPASPTKRFPRPNTVAHHYTGQPLAPRVTAHITSTTSYRPPSPLKYSSTSDIPPSPTARAESGILPSPNTSELSKAYGSVLQPKDTLLTHSCATCSSPFPPDATIYPDPNASVTSNRFLCRPCFTVNGGSKGDCPACHRPVLILKSEGGFVENSGRVWHKRCFRCESCFKNIGDTPMVDLMGRPSCTECFDTCLKRSPGRGSATNSPRRPYDSPEPREKSSNIGGLRGDRKSREGSPAIEELEQRLGIIKSRESSPALEELSQRLSAVAARTPTKDSPSRIPISQRAGSRDGSPLVDRKARGRSLMETSGAGSPFASSINGSPSYRIKYDRQKSPELDSSPSQRIYERFTSPEQETAPQHTGTIAPDDAVEEMKKRFLRHAASSSSLASASSSSSPRRLSSPAVTPQKSTSKIPVASSRHASPSLRSSLSNSSLSSPHSRHSYAGTESSVASTPDLTSDFSDTITESSAPSSPPSRSPPSYKDDPFSSNQRRYIHEEATDEEVEDTYNSRKTPTPKFKSRTLPGQTIPSFSPNKSCGKCRGALFTTKDGGKFVTVPEESGVKGIPPKTYHTGCFRCNVCQGTFKETGTGQAIFVRGDNGPCHPEVSRILFFQTCNITEVVFHQCARPEKIHTRSITIPRTSSPTKVSPAQTPTAAPVVSSSRYNTLPPTTAPATTTSFPRFGSSAACPGCQKSVSVMEMGVVPGPQGTRWHATCLVCGGKDAAAKKRRREEGQEAGCGKRLDSAAKGDGEGGVWCRECLVSS